MINILTSPKKDYEQNCQAFSNRNPSWFRGKILAFVLLIFLLLPVGGMAEDLDSTPGEPEVIQPSLSPTSTLKSLTDLPFPPYPSAPVSLGARRSHNWA